MSGLAVYRVMRRNAPQNGGAALDLQGDFVIAGEVNGVDIGLAVALELFEGQAGGDWREGLLASAPGGHGIRAGVSLGRA